MVFAFPEEARAVGYAALIQQLKLKVVPNWCASYVLPRGESRHGRAGLQEIFLYRSSYAPKDESNPFDQLEFALKHEGLNLEILSAFFDSAGASRVQQWILEHPQGTSRRHVWFLYEWLTGSCLDIPDLTHGNYIDLLNAKNFYTAKPELSRRHRVRNNLLGNPSFCPIVRRAERLRQFEEVDLGKATQDLVAEYPVDVFNRAMRYLFTKETMSSFEIERERPSKARAMRFASLLNHAHKIASLDESTLVQLQNRIVEPRFAATSYRDFQNYIGEQHDLYREYLHYIPPKPGDVGSLMGGLIACLQHMLEAEISPVIIATVLGFGFVFIHPFEDGNGRIHRFLIHHVLARTGFCPPGTIFPISAAMLRDLSSYDAALEAFSQPILDVVTGYELDQEGQLTVEGQTAVHYRYVDYTHLAEYLFACVQQTIQEDFPEELNYLIRYDRTRAAVLDIVDLPDAKVNLLIRCVTQNGGQLSQRKRQKHFAMLSDEEIASLEAAINQQMKKEA